MAYTAPTYKLPIIRSLDLLQAQLNVIFGKISTAQPAYGAALPAIGAVPDGQLFTAAGVLYQAQSGAWVAV